jgi:hypothetical protein
MFNSRRLRAALYALAGAITVGLVVVSSVLVFGSRSAEVAPSVRSALLPTHSSDAPPPTTMPAPNGSTAPDAPTSSEAAPAEPPPAPVEAAPPPPPVAEAPAPPPPPVEEAPAPAESSPGWGCAAALDYLSTHANPAFALECPGNAFGHQAMTCAFTAGYCDGRQVIAIAVPCPAAYMNEASNSWTVLGLRPGPIDPYGSC